MSLKQKRSIYLPSELYKAILKLKLSRIKTSHLIKFIGIIDYKGRNEKLDHVDYVGIPYTYIIKSFNSRYMEWLGPALKTKIIEEKEYVGKGGIKVKFKHTKLVKGKNAIKGLSKAYRINPRLMNNSTVSNLVVSFFEEKRSTLNIDTFNIKGQKIQKSILFNDFKTLKIDLSRLIDINYDSIINFKADFTSGKSNKYFKINNAVETSHFEVRNRIINETYHVKRDKALLHAKD